MFFFQGGMIAQHTRLMTLKKKNWVNKFEFNLDFSNLHNFLGSEWASGVFHCLPVFTCGALVPHLHTHPSSTDNSQQVCIQDQCSHLFSASLSPISLTSLKSLLHFPAAQLPGRWSLWHVSVTHSCSPLKSACPPASSVLSGKPGWSHVPGHSLSCPPQSLMASACKMSILLDSLH